LLLEKRVKSRFSHRMWRVASPLTTEALGWKEVMKHALVPWEYTSAEAGKEGREAKKWKGDWQFAVEVRGPSIVCPVRGLTRLKMLLEHEKVVRTLDRLCGLTTDVRTVYRPFVSRPQSSARQTDSC